MSLPSSQPLSHLEPGIRLLHKSVGFIFQAALRAAIKLKLAEHLQDGPQTAKQIAQKIEANATMIHKILRLLATQNIFTAVDKHQFAMTPEAEFLLADHPHSLHKAVLMLTDKTLWEPSLHVAEMALGEPIFKRIFGESFFEYWEKNANLPHNFHDGMASFSTLENPFITAKYPFPENSLIADIGGGTGGLLLGVLDANPNTQGILFDMQAVTDKHILHKLNDDSRWKIENGSFFEKVPSADFYLLKSICRDWDDDHLIQILTTIRQSMTKTSKVLLIDIHLSHDNQPNFGKNLGLLCSPLIAGADERTQEELEILLQQAGLKTTNILKTDCDLSILEAQIG
ncbi:TPA: methyltransferase [Providencia alcalifaciens]